jgi:hypothetical protein
MPETRSIDPDQQQLYDAMSNLIGDSPEGRHEDLTPLSSEDMTDLKNITMKDGQLRSATLNHLIWICTTDHPLRSRELVNSVCMGWSSFTTETAIWSKICERFESGDSGRQTFEFLCYWVKEGFISPMTLRQVQLYVWNRFPGVKLPKPKTIKDPEWVDETKAPQVELDPELCLWSRRFSMTDLPPVEFARQLTVWTSRLFYSIKRTEYLNGCWEDARRKRRAQNVVRINRAMDVFSKWVELCILQPPEGFDHLSVATYFLKVAKKLYKMNNFMNCIWIQSAFMSPPIFRLKSLRRQLDRDLTTWLDEVDNSLLNFDDNCKIPMEISTAALGSGGPVLPALMCFLNVLTKFVYACPAVSDGQVSVQRIMEISKWIRKIERFQKMRYCFLPIDQAQEFLNQVDIGDVDLDRISREVEPPEEDMEEIDRPL